jgi:hypothetical protein
MMDMLALGLVAATLQASPAACAHRADLMRLLAEHHHESPVARGLSENGALLEIFATHDGSTWTAIGTFPSGLSCLIASGRYWELIPVISIDPERPS